MHTEAKTLKAPANAHNGTNAEARFNDFSLSAHIHACMHSTVLDCSQRVTGFIGGQGKRLQSCTEHIFNRAEATQKCFSLVKQIR